MSLGECSCVGVRVRSGTESSASIGASSGICVGLSLSDGSGVEIIICPGANVASRVGVWPGVRLETQLRVDEVERDRMYSRTVALLREDDAKIGMLLILAEWRGSTPRLGVDAPELMPTLLKGSLLRRGVDAPEFVDCLVRLELLG